MRILGIETSCDETAAAIVKDGIEILSNTVASSISIQQQYGGIVPEVAARHQVEYMYPVLDEAFQSAGLKRGEVDAIAVTVGPGLMGSLLVGVETAKTLSWIWQKPLLPTNHLIGHIHSAWLDHSTDHPPQFPLLALIASGGHTELILLQSHSDLRKIGSTRDDAVGEAFDKVARALGLGYPGGPIIERLAQTGDPQAYELPRPMLNSGDYDFSYSGLKTAVIYTLQDIDDINAQVTRDLAASFQAAALEVLVVKTLRAAQELNVRSIVVTGGVAANQRLRELFEEQLLNEIQGISLHVPPLTMATDNATYIAGSGYFLYNQIALDPQVAQDTILYLEPDPNLSVEQVKYPE